LPPFRTSPQDRLRRQSRPSKRGNLVALALSIGEASICSQSRSPRSKQNIEGSAFRLRSC
jgi:hypothetical protein